MGTALPFRSRAGNTAHSAAAPAALHLVASRAVDSDRTLVVLRADLSDLTRDGARRHAHTVLDAIAAKWSACQVDVQLLDGSGAPVLKVTRGAADGGAS